MEGHVSAHHKKSSGACQHKVGMAGRETLTHGQQRRIKKWESLGQADLTSGASLKLYAALQ